MLCKILAFFILPCLVISFKMDMKPALKDESADLINAIQAYDKIVVEINGHPIQANRLDNITSESPGRNQCQDSAQYASNCPGWTWACTDPRYVSFMQNNCKKSCGLCSDPGQCQDSNQYASNCPGWTWACTDPRYISFMQNNCQKSCGWCTTGSKCQGATADWSCCKSSSPCKENEGDCDTDSDCESGLVCGTDNCPSGFPSSAYDCCYKPSGNTECAKIPSWMKSDLANKIVNGKTAPSPIPWQVHLRQGNPTGQFEYFCGGTIIDAKTILTAAHCYHGKNLNAADFFITVGVVHVQDGAGQSVFVEKITLHESYNPSTINNDIAILKLKTPLTFNNNVQPACLPEASFVPIGRAVASGWGLVSQFPDQSPNNLQWVTMPVVTNDKCVQAPFKWGVGQITANMICAGDADGGESTCEGDSGGPLVIPKSSTDDTAVVIGATSFGKDGCGVQGFPAVYAYVTRYINWIKPQMES